MTQKHIEQKLQRPVYVIPSFPELIAITFGASSSRKLFFVHLHIIFKQVWIYYILQFISVFFLSIFWLQNTV